MIFSSSAAVYGVPDVDLVTEDISKPLSETGGAIVEVNAGPGLLMHLKPMEGEPRPVGRIGVEPAVQPLVEGGVGRAIVDEGPAEGLAVEGLGLRHVRRRQFEVVQLAVFTHG